MVKQKIALEGLTLALAMLVCQLVLILAIATVWFYQAGNEGDGIAVEMTPQGELIAADEGFG